MFLILYTEIITCLMLCFIYNYRVILFNNLFYLILTSVTLAFIPNFVTSLLLNTSTISNTQSQVAFGVTGSIVLIFLYQVLSKYKVM